MTTYLAYVTFPDGDIKTFNSDDRPSAEATLHGFLRIEPKIKVELFKVKYSGAGRLWVRQVPLTPLGTIRAALPGKPSTSPAEPVLEPANLP